LAIKIQFKNRKINKVMLSICVLLTLITIYQALDQRRFIQSAEYTVGVVTKVIVEENSDGDETYWPIVKFTAQDTKVYEFKSNVINTDYGEGADIPVLYQKGDEANAIIWSDAAIWSRVYALLFLVCITIFYGIGIFKF
jgi:hypothetical protein